MESRDFSIPLIFSVIFHIALFCAFFFAKDISFSGPISDVVIAPSVRVDVVSMPTISLKELKQMAQATASEANEEEVKVAAKEKEAENDYIKKAKKKNFKDMLSRLANKKINSGKKKSKGDKKNKLSQRQARKIDKLLLAGNKLSKGSAIVGNVESENTTELTAYISMIPEIIRPYWSLPSFLANKGLSCRIRIFLNSEGEVVKYDLRESSGEQEYDRRAISAIMKASPFPKPVAQIVDSLVDGVVTLAFPL